MAKRANGDGTVFRRGDGRWAAAISLPGGKRQHFVGTDRDAVVRQKTAATKSLNDGLPAIVEHPTVEQYLKSWLKITKQSVRERTWVRYEQFVRLQVVPKLGTKKLHALKPDHLQALYTECLDAGLSSTTVHHLHAMLHRALKQGVRWNRVQRNIADLVDPPRPAHHDITTLSVEQVSRLFRAAERDRLESLYVTAVMTGMRQGELLGLHWRDVDLDRGAIQIRGTMSAMPSGLRFAETKTRGSRRQVLLTQRAVDALRRHRAAQAAERLRIGPGWEDQDLVFANQAGKPITASNLLRRSFEPLLKRADLPRIRFHDLRHTAATLLLEQNVNAKVVQEMLGHTRISTTLDLYSHVTPTMQQRAVETLDRAIASQ